MNGKKPTIYLCGPIQNRTDEQCVTWRKAAAEGWNGQILDPMRRDYRGRELDDVAGLVHDDLDDIVNSDGVLVYFDAPSVGTSMEIFFAKHTLGLPVVVVDATGGAQLSPWLVHHADRVVVGLVPAMVVLYHLIHDRRARHAR